ncbi:MAG: hypothetical protein PVJ66_01825 [Gammaproteobacteria bacterium]|jgi:hypothetical protein
MNKPGIVTAIPKRRYTYGEFTVVVLGEVESSDAVDYRYIAAVVRGQDPEPGLYVTAEQGGAHQGASCDMRVVMRDGSQVVGTSERWNDLEAFTTEALAIIARILNLGDEMPYRLM